MFFEKTTYEHNPTTKPNTMPGPAGQCPGVGARRRLARTAAGTREKARMNTLTRLESDAAAILAKLQWPSDEVMLPYLARLLNNPGSCVVVVIESPLAPDGPRVGKAWLSSQERAAVRKALQAINQRRAAKGESPTTQPETP
jgi:hypothetical protein